jgi:hypothetical protein
MFFTLALFAISFILTAVLAPKTKIENAKAQSLNDFSFPRSKQGDPLGRVYGTVKVLSPNTIGQANFVAEPIKKKVKTGLFSSKKVITGYKYKSGLDLAVGLGPEVVFKRMWFGKYEVWNDCFFDGACENTFVITLPDLYGGAEKNGGVGGTITTYCGAFDQTQNAYLAAQLDANISSYPGIAHVVFQDFWFGNSANILPIYFEVSHFSDSMGLGSLDGSINIMPNGLDANLVEVLHDLYTNDWANLGIDPAKIDTASWVAAAETCFDEGNGGSLEINNPTDGKDLSQQILNQLNGIVYEDPQTGLIMLKLIRNDYTVGALPVYSESEVIEVTNFTKKLWNETRNLVRVKYTDRDNGYAQDAIAIATDLANVRFQGRQNPSEARFPACYTAGLANTLAARELSNLNVPLFQVELLVNRTASTLRPGDVFVFSSPSRGITQLVLRARKFGLGSLEDGSISVHCVQDEFAVDATVIGAPTPSLNEVPITPVTEPTVFSIIEYPYFLTRASGYDLADTNTAIGAFVQAPSATSLTYDVWNTFIDVDTTDVEVLTGAGYSSYGTLAADIGQWDDFATGEMTSLVVNGFVGDADLLADTFTESETRRGYGLFLIDDEFFAFTSAVDNLDGTHTLSSVRRAFIDTKYAAHTAGAKVWFPDGQDEVFNDLFTGVVDTTFKFNFVDRSLVGTSGLDGSTANTYIGKQRPLAPLRPANITIDASRAVDPVVNVGDVITIAWNARNKTETTLAFETEATQTPETDQTTTLYMFDIVTATRASLTAVPADTEELAVETYDLTLTNDHAGKILIGAEAVMPDPNATTYTSYSGAEIPISVARIDGLLTIDYDLIEEAAEGIGAA